MVAPPGSEAATPSDANALRRMSRLSLDYLVDSIELSRAGGDVIDRLLVAAILDANVAPVKQDADLQLAYSALDAAPPERLRRPVSISAVAHSLRLPFETVRRRVARLARQGVLVVTPRGVLVSQARLESPAFKALSLARYERLRRFYCDLVDAQALPPISTAPADAAGGGATEALGESPPVRIANRLLAEYLMRCIEAVMSRVDHPVDGLLLLHMARANLHLVEEATAPLAPLGTAALAERLALSPETVRRRLQALERVGLCARSRKGAVLGPAIVADPAAATLLQENAVNVERLFTRLARLGVLAAWRAESQAR